jgi:SAM-dependent methyltransferase
MAKNKEGGTKMAIETAFDAEFDSFAHEYESLHSANVTASGYPPSYFAEYKIKEIARHLRQLGRLDKEVRFLNFGCGIGNSEAFIRKHIPRSIIYSTDVSSKSVEYARERHKDMTDVNYAVTDGRSLPFNRSFDVIFVANVLHHTPRAGHVRMLQMLRKALTSEGWLFVFEHNPLNPLTLHAFNTCPFDKGAVLLPPWYGRKIFREAGFQRRRLRFTLFFPKLLAFLAPSEKYLNKVPFGAQYYIAAKR